MRLCCGAVVLCCLLSAACSSTTPQSTNAHATNPVVILAHRVQSTWQQGNYYYSAAADAPTGAVDTRKAVEFISADPAVFEGTLYLRNRTDQTITAYSVDGNNQLHAGSVLSFQSYGLPGRRVYDAYISKTQAYALDGTNLKLVEWNPTTMNLTGNVIDVGSLGDPNMTMSFGPPLSVNGQVYTQLSWASDAGLFYPNLAVLVIDGSGNAPTVMRDSRAGGGYALYADASGNIYAPGLTSGDLRHFGTASNGATTLPPDAVLKLPAGATSFDSSYQVNLTSIIQSSSIYAAHWVDATHVLAQVIDPAADTSGYTVPGDYVDSGSYVFVMVDTSTSTYTTVSAIAQGYGANALPHIVDGVLYVQTASDTGSSVFAVSGNTVTAAFTVPGGDLWDLERLR